MTKVLIAHAPRILVEELLRRGHRLCVAHTAAEAPRPGPAAAGSEFVPFPRRAKTDPRAIRDMRRLVRRHRPDIIHAFSPRSLAAATLGTIGLRPAPQIVSFRGIATSPRRIDLGDLITFLWPGVKAHACESQAVADGLVRVGVDARDCHVIYNCVDPLAIRQEDRGTVRDRLGIPRDAFVVGSIANIRPVKGIDILLRAALECLDLGDLHVVLVGAIRDRVVGDMIGDPRWDGRLHATGFVPDGGGIATAFDLFVMPSRQEALCRALLEAMHVGSCPVVSDAGGMKELVRHGREGLVVPREDAGALVAAIRRLHGSRDLIRVFGAAAQARVRSMCTPAAVADHVERLYDAVLSGPAPVMAVTPRVTAIEA
ncbi:glycosyltransferase family 1 protein [bacterium]|nr:glycosyltransferase family 1 protein [bacterium]